MSNLRCVWTRRLKIIMIMIMIMIMMMMMMRRRRRSPRYPRPAFPGRWSTVTWVLGTRLRWLQRYLNWASCISRNESVSELRNWKSVFKERTSWLVSLYAWIFNTLFPIKIIRLQWSLLHFFVFSHWFSTFSVLCVCSRKAEIQKHKFFLTFHCYIPANFS